MKNLALLLLISVLILGCEKEELITEDDVNKREFLELQLRLYNITAFQVYQAPKFDPILDIVECENLSFDIIPEDRGLAINFFIQDKIECTENLYYKYADIHLQGYWEEAEEPIHYIQIRLSE